jgi:hypothetical protein
MKALDSATLTVRCQSYAAARDPSYLSDVLSCCIGASADDLAALLIAYVPQDAIAELVCKHAAERLELDAIEQSLERA